jgi:hypothetical protein
MASTRPAEPPWWPIDYTFVQATSDFLAVGEFVFVFVQGRELELDRDEPSSP